MEEAWREVVIKQLLMPHDTPGERLLLATHPFHESVVP
jgi:hypothetical protein